MSERDELGLAAHLVMLGIVIAVALVVFAIGRRRNKRDAAEPDRTALTQRALTQRAESWLA